MSPPKCRPPLPSVRILLLLLLLLLTWFPVLPPLAASQAVLTLLVKALNRCSCMEEGEGVQMLSKSGHPTLTPS